MAKQRFVKAVTPQLIDDKAREYQKLEAAYDSVKAELDAKYDELVELVQEHGRTPARANKSKRLEGADFELTVSVGESVSVDTSRVEKLREWLSANRVARAFFSRLFESQTSYRPAQGADEAVLNFEGRRSNLWKLYRACFVIKATSPRLKVQAKEQGKAKAAKA